MGNRPVDWSPIADADPTPGDPYEVRQEAKRLEDIAATIRDQVKLLREAGKAKNLKGQYADKLKEGAEDLADKLSKAEGRYDKVGDHLREWAKELEHAQELTRKALSHAKVDPKDEDRVKDAKGKMGEGIRHYVSLGGKIANKIDDAIDDAVEDGFFDDVVGWVKDHAEGFKLFLDVLSWIGTALAIVSMFIPGVNLLVIIGIGIGLAVVAGRALLVAAGEATWMDVAIDSIGLLSFGAGKIAMAGLKGAGATAKAAASTSRVAKLKDGLAATKFMRNRLATALAGASDDASKAAIRSEMNTLRKLISRDAGKVADGAPPVGKFAKAANLGDDEAYGVYKNVMTNASRFPDAVPGGAVTGAKVAYGAAATAAWAGIGSDVGDKVLGDNDTLNWVGEHTGGWKKDSWDAYNDFKGNTWQAPARSAW
ncbi:hypothetical protein [Streptomyces boninensis]|uniref:hypothetical protein n=1 Tax=Streptomyces boninensis TaxID=2039455 RepID=UPI003B2172F8